MVRIKPNVAVSCSLSLGTLRKYPTKQGMSHLLRQFDDRKDRRVRNNIVIHWREE